jgi:hypothetical protein
VLLRYTPRYVQFGAYRKREWAAELDEVSRLALEPAQIDRDVISDDGGIERAGIILDPPSPGRD